MEKINRVGPWLKRVSLFLFLIGLVSYIVLQKKVEAAPVPTAGISQSEMTIKEGDASPLSVFIETNSFINDMQAPSVSAAIQNLQFFTQNCGGYNQVVSSSAKADEDFVAIDSESCDSETVSFSCAVEPASTQSFYIRPLVKTIEDEVPEADECFKVCVKSANNAFVTVNPNKSCVEVKIVDDEPKFKALKPVEVKRANVLALPQADNNGCSFLDKPCVYFTKNQPVVVNEAALYAELPFVIDNRVQGNDIDGIKVYYYIAPDYLESFGLARLGEDFFFSDNPMVPNGYLYEKNLSNVEIKGGEIYQSSVKISINKDSIPEHSETAKICIGSVAETTASYKVGMKPAGEEQGDPYRGWCSSLVIVDND